MLLLAFSTLFVSIFCMNLLIAKMTTRYDAIANASASYRRFQHITLIKRYKDEGPPPPINLAVALGAVVSSAIRRSRGLCGKALPKKAMVQSSAFTVYAGHAATRQSERIERSYLRDFLREDEARATAKRDHAEALVELPAAVNQLRQDFAERLERLEASARHSTRFSKLASSFRSLPSNSFGDRHPGDGWGEAPVASRQPTPQASHGLELLQESIEESSHDDGVSSVGHSAREDSSVRSAGRPTKIGHGSRCQFDLGASMPSPPQSRMP